MILLEHFLLPQLSILLLFLTIVPPGVRILMVLLLYLILIFLEHEFTFLKGPQSHLIFLDNLVVLVVLQDGFGGLWYLRLELLVLKEFGQFLGVDF